MASKSNWNLIKKVLSFGTDHAQVWTQHIISSDNEVSSQMTLILVEHFWCGYNKWTDSGFATAVQSLQLKIWRLEKVDELSVGSCTSTTAVDVWSNVMNFLTVFLYDDGSSSGSGISSEDDTSIVLDTADGSTGFFIWHGFDDIFLLKELVSCLKRICTFDWIQNWILPFVRCSFEGDAF